MEQCPKCGALNEEGLTRCASCKAIIPVRMDSTSPVRYERVAKTPEDTGVKCPSCGTLNPYTRLRCGQCNVLLSGERKKSWRDNLLVYVGAAVMVVVLVMVLVRAL
jgi:predicted nucleic acid-binding Zn ribbon protein